MYKKHVKDKVLNKPSYKLSSKQKKIKIKKKKQEIKLERK